MSSSSSSSSDEDDDAPVEISGLHAKHSFSELQAAESGSSAALQLKQKRVRGREVERQQLYAQLAAEKRKKDASFLEDVDALFAAQDSEERTAEEQAVAKEEEFREAQLKARVVNARRKVLYGDEIVKQHEGGFTVHLSSSDAAAMPPSSSSSSSSSSKSAKLLRKRKHAAMLLTTAFASAGGSVVNVMHKLRGKHERVAVDSHVSRKVKQRRRN